jgi:Uma2 family endonuclease
MPLESPLAPTHETLLGRWQEIIAHEPDLFKNHLERIETDSFGNILMSPPPSGFHRKVAFRIAILLDELLPGDGSVQEQYLVTDIGIKVADVVWLNPNRSHEIYKDHPLQPAPDICVEVRSPSNTARELEEKRDAYFRAGAKEVWICDMNHRITFFSPEGELGQSILCPAFPKIIHPSKS